MWKLCRMEVVGIRESIMRLRLVLAVLWTIVILVLCWTPQTMLPVNEKPDSIVNILHLDKVIHSGIFSIFSVLWLRTQTAGKSRYVWVVLGGTALGAITEIVQNLPIINREGEFEDFLADFAGVLMGFPIFHLMEQRLRGRNNSKRKQVSSLQEVVKVTDAIEGDRNNGA